MKLSSEQARRGLVLCILFATATGWAQSAPEFGRPMTALKASQVLPAKLRSGPHHRVAERVVNDGYINTYSIQSDFGVISAVSTPMLEKRVAEIKAMALMEQVESSESYQDALKAAGEGTVEGLKKLVEDPEASLEGAVSGVGRMFRMAGESLRSKRSDSEGKRWESIIGKEKAKRDVAYEFGVDVYSANPLLQQRLDDLTWASYAGKMSITALKTAIPGGVGLVVSVSDSTKLLNELVATSSPLKLRDLNRQHLAELGMDPLLVDLYIDNQSFTPREQTFLVGALQQLEQTAGKDQYLRLAIRTHQPELAFQRARIAHYYAAYNRNRTPLESFVSMGPFVLGRTSDTLVFIVPVDFLVWTRDTALITRELGEQATSLPGITQKELWLPGIVDERSREQLKAGGWALFEQCETRLSDSQP